MVEAARARGPSLDPHEQEYLLLPLLRLLRDSAFPTVFFVAFLTTSLIDIFSSSNSFFLLDIVQGRTARYPALAFSLL